MPLSPPPLNSLSALPVPDALFTLDDPASNRAEAVLAERLRELQLQKLILHIAAVFRDFPELNELSYCVFIEYDHDPNGLLECALFTNRARFNCALDLDPNYCVPLDPDATRGANDQKIINRLCALFNRTEEPVISRISDKVFSRPETAELLPALMAIALDTDQFVRWQAAYLLASTPSPGHAPRPPPRL